MAFPGRNDPARRNARFEREVDNPFTRPQTARASFHPPDRNQSRPAHQIASGTSYVSAHPSPKHLDRKAAPAQPAFRTPGISHIATRPQTAHRRHARHAANRIPNSMSTKPPMPFLPGLSHFPEKASALFHVEGKTRERRRVRNASPPEKEPAMVEQTFECSNCYEVFNKEHTTEVLWTQCPHCGGRAYPY